MGNRRFWRWCYSVQEKMLLLVLSQWKSCPGYSSFSRSFSSSIYATLQLFHIMAVLWHWVLWCCTGNASLVTLLNMSVFQYDWKGLIHVKMVARVNGRCWMCWYQFLTIPLKVLMQSSIVWCRWILSLSNSFLWVMVSILPLPRASNQVVHLSP
jgi:hypothetical protein